MTTNNRVFIRGQIIQVYRNPSSEPLKHIRFSVSVSSEPGKGAADFLFDRVRDGKPVNISIEAEGFTTDLLRPVLVPDFKGEEGQ